MNIISINVDQNGCMDTPLLIGYAGEDNVDAVDFDFSAWVTAYGEGEINLEIMRANDTAPYLAILAVDGTVARWTISNVDTAKHGPGVAQLVYQPTGATKKSAIYKFFVGKSLTEPGGDDPWGPIIERLEELLGEMQQEAADTRENAAAADQSAQDAAASALAASGSEVNAGISAGAAAESEGKAAASESNAEAWAVGERGGEPVADTDPTFDNNAKYYAELASASEAVAEDAAPFYAVYGLTTASEISSALNRKGQVFLRTLDERSIAPFVTEFRWSRPGAAGRGFRFAKIEGTVQHVYELTDAWTSYTNDLNAPAQRAEAAAASAASSQTAAEGSATSAASSATAAAGSAADAATAKTAAEAAQTAAAASEADASDSADSAASSATAASGSATAAANSATAAGNAKTAAETAQEKAEDAQEAAEQAQEVAEAVLESIPSDYTELSDDVDDLKSAVNQKAPAIYDTASGAIASFEDGADGMPLKSLTVSIEPVQEGSGDPSPENVRPITGWTGCNVTRTGKNLWKPFDSQTINGVTLTVDDDGGCSLTGTATANAIFAIPVTILPGSYYLAANNPDIIGSSVRLMLVSNTGGADKQIYLSVANAAAPITLDTEYNQLRIRVNAGAAFTSTKFYPQLELGSTGTAYEPFVANDIYPITFPSDAGTVYRGTLDVTNGVLIVTHFGGKIKDNEWSYAEGNAAFVCSDFKTGVHAAKRPASNTVAANIIAEQFEPTSYSGLDNGCVAIASSGNCFVRVANLTDVSAFINTYGNSKIVFELAAPISYQLTPQEITTLIGTNNIWADCGDVSVDYPIDTKQYINQVDDDILSSIAPFEETYTASRNYAVGSYLFVGTKFYKVTSAIQTGGTINPGTNVAQTTVAEQLMTLAVKPAILG